MKGGLDLNHLRDTSQLESVLPCPHHLPDAGRVPDVHARRCSGGPTCITAPSYPGHQPDLDRRRAAGLAGRRRDSGLNHTSFGLLRPGPLASRAPRLSVTYGLRYDVEVYPSQLHHRRRISTTCSRALGARVRVQFRAASIRAGYGVFADRLASSVGQLFNATQWSSAGSLPNAQRALSHHRADSGHLPAAHRRRRRRPDRGAHVPDHRTGADDEQSRARRHARRRHPDAVQPPGERADLARDRPRDRVVGRATCSSARGRCRGTPETSTRFRTARWPPASRSSAGAPTRRSAISSSRPTPATSNYHGATFEAQKRVRERRRLPWQLHAGPRAEQRRFARQPGRSSRGPGHRRARRRCPRQDVRHRFTLTLLSQVPSTVAVVHGP